MKTPTRIQHTNSRMTVPKVPMRPLSNSATAMPKAPPHPVEQQRLPRVPATKPRVSEPRIMTRHSASTEWLSNMGRWRMMRMPTSISTTGTRMPQTPSERSTSKMPSRAPVPPHQLRTVSRNSSGSSLDLRRILWSASQQKNEEKSATAANTPTQSNSKPTIQRMLSVLLR